MQDSHKLEFASHFRFTLRLVACLCLLLSAQGIYIWQEEQRPAPTTYPARSVQCEIKEKAHTFQATIRFEYLVDGRWVQTEKTFPVDTYAYARDLQESAKKANQRVHLDPDDHRNFYFVFDREGNDSESNLGLKLVVGSLIFAWLLLTLQKIRPNYAIVTLLCLFAMLLSWLGVTVLSLAVENYQETRKWVKVPTTVEFYEVVVFSQVNTRYRYTFEGRQYTGARVHPKLWSRPELHPRKIAWMLLNGSEETTCYVNPENPEEACLTYDVEGPTLMGLTFLGVSGAMFILAGIAVGGKGLLMTEKTDLRRRIFFRSSSCLVGLYTATWLPSLFLRVRGEGLFDALLVAAPILVAFAFSILLWKLGRKVDLVQLSLTLARKQGAPRKLQTPEL